MKNTTITIWVSPSNEYIFFEELAIISSLPLDNAYKWNTNHVEISREMISNWLWVNIDIETYFKFASSFRNNGGKFTESR